jgi:hypothetical protein
MSINFYSTVELNGGATVTGLPTPVNASDATPKSYVDSAIEGINWKDSARVATQSNINLSSPGSSIDGITLTNGDRVLVIAQTTQSQNGIYVFNGASTPMTRALDANSFNELEQATITVEEGTNAGATYRQTQVNGTIDSSNIIFTVFGGNIPDATESTSGKIEIATQSEVNAGTDDQRAITPLKLANYTGLLRKIAQNIGDGSNTSYTVTHNLNTRDVKVAVFPNSGNYDDVWVEVRRPTVNAVAIIFEAGFVPTNNAFRVVIIG